MNTVSGDVNHKAEQLFGYGDLSTCMARAVEDHYTKLLSQMIPARWWEMAK